MGKKEKNYGKNNPRNTKEQQLFLETTNRKFRSNRKLNTSRAEEGYCNEATQSRPSTHSQSHQALNTYIKKYRGKTKYGLDMGRNKRNYVVKKVSHRQLQEGE